MITFTLVAGISHKKDTSQVLFEGIEARHKLLQSAEF